MSWILTILYKILKSVPESLSVYICLLLQLVKILWSPTLGQLFYERSNGRKKSMHACYSTPNSNAETIIITIWTYLGVQILEDPSCLESLSLSLSLHCISMEVASKLALEQEDKLGLNISKKAFKLAYTLYLCSYLLNLIWCLCCKKTKQEAKPQGDREHWWAIFVRHPSNHLET